MIEDHFTSECPKGKDYKICSECSSTSHTWRECKEEDKKCINCGGNHRTLAYKCLEKKKARKTKTSEIKEKTKQSYSQATSGHQLTPLTNLNLGKDAAATILTCMMHSHLMNIANPGSYNIEINKLLAANKLPRVIQPDNPPSRQILDTTQARIQENQPIGENQADKAETGKDNITTEDTPSKESSETGKGSREYKEINSKDIGLEIFAKQSEGFPKEDFSLRSLTTGMLQGKYKWTYTSTNYREEDILRLLNNNEISLRDSCWIQTSGKYETVTNNKKHHHLIREG